MTWEQIINLGYDSVIVESYGYNEVNIFGIHFEPFKNKREFVFNVRGNLDNPEECWLDHPWLNLTDPESELEFKLRDDNKVYLFDPDLFIH